MRFHTFNGTGIFSVRKSHCAVAEFVQDYKTSEGFLEYHQEQPATSSSQDEATYSAPHGPNPVRHMLHIRLSSTTTHNQHEHYFKSTVRRPRFPPPASSGETADAMGPGQAGSTLSPTHGSIEYPIHRYSSLSVTSAHRTFTSNHSSCSTSSAKHKRRSCK